MTNVMIEGLTRLHGRLGFWPQVEQPPPDFGGPGVSALTSIAGVAFAWVLVLALIAGLGAAAMITLGHLSGNNRVQKIGVIGAICAVAGVALAGSLGGLLTWAQTLKVA